jgi:hypothetical protein
MRTVWPSRVVAVALAAALGIPFFPAQASPAAALTGRVVAAGTEAPLAGARVHVGDRRTSRIVTSGMTRDDGSFEVSGLPPAAYEVAVESKGGLYLVEAPLPLRAGERRAVQLVVSEGAPPAKEPEGEASPGTPAARMSWWNNPLTATLVVVGGAVIVGVLIGSVVENEPTSPSLP